MNQILELREKRAKAWDAAKKFLDAKTGPDGLVSAEDSATYDKMEADVLALGDGRNDIEMLTWAGRGVALGEAPDEVKRAADDVAERFDRGGTAKELQRWFRL